MLNCESKENVNFWQGDLSIFPTVVHLLSCIWPFATPWTAAHQAPLSITNSQSLLKLMSIESLIPSNHLILCHLLLLQPSIFPRIRVFSSESVLQIRWPKYWSFSFSISPSNEYSGLISFRIDWFDLLIVLGTLKNPLDCKEIKPVHPKGNQSWIFLDGLMLKLKLQYFGHLIWRTDSLEKTLMLGKFESRRPKRLGSVPRGDRSPGAGNGNPL